MPRPYQKTTGTPEPMPGCCGARLAGSDPPRYCSRKTKDGGRCRFNGHSGNGLVGPCAPNFKHGRGSKYLSVLPPGMMKHFNAKPLREVASCREEIALVDARNSEVLEATRRANPVGSVHSALSRLHVLEQALANDNKGAARRAAKNLGDLLSKVAVAAANWDEVRKNLELRDKLVKTEQGYQKLLSDRIMVEQINNFVRALIIEARMLTEDRKLLNAYVLRVLELGRGAVGAALLPAGEGDAVDAEIVEEEP